MTRPPQSRCPVSRPGSTATVADSANCKLAARGGLDGAEFAWGDELTPGGRWMANTWQGEFPVRDTGQDGYRGTSPAGACPANGYGLPDMIGSVWEWTADWTAVMPPRRTPAARRRRAAAGRPASTGMIRRVLPARSSRAARTCARRTTAAATGPPPGWRRPSTPRPATWASAAIIRPAREAPQGTTSQPTGRPPMTAARCARSSVSRTPGTERARGLAYLGGPDRGRGRVRVQQQDAHVNG